MKYIKNLTISADNEHNFKISNQIDKSSWLLFHLQFDNVTTDGKKPERLELDICWNGVGGVQLVATKQDGIYIVPEYQVHLLGKVMNEHKSVLKVAVLDYAKNLYCVIKLGRYGKEIELK